MSWISHQLLPAIAGVMRQHHAAPRTPATPAELSRWLRANEDCAEAEFTAHLAPGPGFRALVQMAHAMLSQEE